MWRPGLSKLKRGTPVTPAPSKVTAVIHMERIEKSADEWMDYKGKTRGT